jgi:hypothetical protein
MNSLECGASGGAVRFIPAEIEVSQCIELIRSRARDPNGGTRMGEGDLLGRKERFGPLEIPLALGIAAHFDWRRCERLGRDRRLRSNPFTNSW